RTVLVSEEAEVLPPESECFSAATIKHSSLNEREENIDRLLRSLWILRMNFTTSALSKKAHIFLRCVL
ncbi:hypothetical protein, partial [Gracilibacillus sp. YIM 98692]|uniref:hypothetical protein n=1 Tax=Gracilibacillus sp. YIM 98692 TaxID=2663532 RepID=UPI001969FE69